MADLPSTTRVLPPGELLRELETRTTRRRTATRPRRVPRRLGLFGGIAGAALLSVGMVVPALAAPVIIDMTTAGATATYGDAIFTQGPLPTSAGTGVLDPFLRVSDSNSDIVQGYNTNYRPLQYQEDSPWTEALLLSTVPTIEQGGQLYRVFFLDINQVNSKPLLSLDELRLFLAGSPMLHDFDPTANTFGGVAYTPIWKLNAGDYVKLDYSLEAGSGDSDMTMLVPEELFGSASSCDYGQSGCTTWLYFYNKFGVNFANNDGFEEWATQVLPYVQLSKTATGTFDRTYSWTIDKTGIPLIHNLWAGGTGTTDYDIPVDQTVVDSNIQVTGTITITVPPKLPDGEKDSPDAVVTSLTDVLDQGGVKTTGTISSTCATPFTVKGGSSKTCTYTVAPPSAAAGTNTVTAVVQDNPTDFVYSTGVTFTPTIKGYPTVNVTDKFGADTAYSLGSASADKTFTDDHDFTCSTDPAKYTNGFYSYQVKNVATIVETGQNADETVTVNCYAPVVTKDVTTYFDRHWDWTITKDYDATYDLFAGGDVTHSYKVSVAPTSTDNGWGVKGKIYVANPNPNADMTLTSVSDLAGGIAGVVSCPSLAVPKGGSLTCTYDTGAQSSPNSNPFGATNTATAVFAGANWTGSASIAFSATPTTEEDPVITVDDNNLTGESWTANRAAASWTYDKVFECSSDPGDYTDGEYSYSLTNTAKINETGQTDTAKVDVNCYAPVVSKTAAGTYDKTYTWTIDKTKDGEYWKFIGDAATSHDYSVAVDQTITDAKFAVTGAITVENPAPMAMTVALADKLSTGETATFSDCTSPITIAASSSKVCHYSAAPASQAAGTNTATATLNSIDFTASQGYTFTANVIGYPTINVNDTNGGLGSASIDTTWNYSQLFGCPLDPSKYTDGVAYYEKTNTATIAETGQFDTATVKVHCYLPLVSKTATATFDRAWDWTIDKKGTVSTLELAVGQTYLHDYTVDVNATKTDSAFGVTGSITIENPAPMAMPGVSLVDQLSSGEFGAITCPGGADPANLTIPASGDVTCTYAATPASAKAGDVGTNTATATLNKFPFTGTKGYTYTIDQETDECADFSDSIYGDLGTVCANQVPKQFAYSLLIGPYETCGAYKFTNTASFVTNDTEATGSDGWTVDVTVPCEGCTLTQGYWKTHSEKGPAPYDDAWSLLDAWYFDTQSMQWVKGDGIYLKSQEPFFSNKTTFTWYDVFWTPPAGNAYYQLAHQYEAAVLNVLNEASAPASVTSAIAHAEYLFETYTPADIDAMKGNNAVRKDFIATAGTLGSYNTGAIGPGHCDEDRLSSKAP